MADHPDDQTDDIETLKENLRHVRGLLTRKEKSLTDAEQLVSAMRDQLQEEAELRQSWIEVFDLEMDENGVWKFDRQQTDLWNKFATLYQEHLKLLGEWNKFVPLYNAKVTPTP